MEQIPQKQYERSMNHNYMILGKRNFFGQTGETDYRAQMLMHNKIEGLLPTTYRMVNGEERYYYEISSLQSMDKVCTKNEIGNEQLITLLQGCISLYGELEKYLLDGAGLLLSAEYIYVNLETMRPYFVYYPEYNADSRKSFADFIEELLSLIDHTDEQAVMLMYRAYRYTRNPNYVLSEIADMLRKDDREERAADMPVMAEPYQREYTPVIPQEPVETDKTEKKEKKSRKDLYGTILCVVILLAAIGLLLGESVFGLYTLNEKEQMYLYGAISMALAAAVISFVCYLRRKRREDELEALQEENVPDLPEPTPVRYERERPEPVPAPKPACEESQQECYGDTVCLQQLPIQEYCLCGRVGGEDLTIRLNRLPLTIGKLPGWADCIIADSTISKLHARLEEHGGTVYIKDLNSTNGTMRNGTMLGINESVALAVGDELTLGRVSLRFCR